MPTLPGTQMIIHPAKSPFHCEALRSSVLTVITFCYTVTTYLLMRLPPKLRNEMIEGKAYVLILSGFPVPSTKPSTD